MEINRPSGTVNGDLLIASIRVTRAGSVTNGISLSAPSGWTIIRTDLLDDRSRVTTYSKVANNEPTSYTWSGGNTNSPSQADFAILGGILRITGADTNDVVDVSGGIANDVDASADVPAGAVTTTVANTLLIYSGSLKRGAGSFTPPTNMTEIIDIAAGTSGNARTTFTMARENRTTAGSTGNKTGVASFSGRRQIGHLVAINPVPCFGSATITGTTTICNGASTTLTVNVTGDNGPYTYNWSGGNGTTQSITVSPSSTTTYTVTVTGSNSCTGTVSQAVTVNTNPTVSITPTPANATLTCSQTSVTLASSGSGISTRLWSTGATTANIAPTSPGTYTITVTSTAGCTATTSIQVQQNITPPTAGITNNSGTTVLTCTTPSISVTATGGTSYAWSGGLGSGASKSISSPGTYTVTVTGSNGCTATSSIAITQNITPPAASSSGGGSFCLGLDVPLTASGGGTYLWTGGATTSEITVSPANTTTYTVTVTNTANGCTATSAQTVTIVSPLETTTLTYNSSTTWTVPEGVTSIEVEAWGGGGAGGGTDDAPSFQARGGAGGGGGAYAKANSLTVTPGQQLNIVVGTGGAGVSAGNGGNGGNSTITEFSSSILAEGGKGGIRNVSGGPTATGGAGGSATNSIGDTKASGSNGGSGSTAFGITSGAGGNAASPGGGTGGAGVPSVGNNSNGNPGNPPGGGGSGSRTSQSGGPFTGGAGANGRIVIKYSLPVVTASITGGDDEICAGEEVTLTASGGGTYLWSNSETTAAITVSPASTTTYTVTVTGTAGCTATASQIVSVGGASGPSITCPDDKTVYLDSSCGATVDDYTEDEEIELSTECGDPADITVTQSASPEEFMGHNSFVTITLTATLGMETDECTFTVTAIDNTPPSITCPADQTVAADGDCEAALPDYTSLASTSDNCAITLNVSQTPLSGSGTTLSGHNSTQTVTLTANDSNGNSNTCTFTVTLKDTTDPAITCPDDQTVSADADCEGEVGSWMALSVSDNCASSSAMTVMQSPAATTVLSGHNDSETVTLTVSDGNGNSNACSFTVTLKDTTEPTIVCPDAQNVNLSSQCRLVYPNLVPLATAEDNCSGFTVTQSPVAFSAVDSYHSDTDVVTLTITDINGNTAACTVVVTTIDVTNPTITACEGAQDVILDADCAITIPDVTDGTSASDNCTYTLTQSPMAGSTQTSSHNGSITVTVIATDDAGRMATCTVVLTAKDETDPTIECPADRDVNLDANCEISIPDLVADATAEDNCTVSSVVQSIASGEKEALAHNETIDITLTVTDGAGLTSECVVTLTAKDVTAPFITMCPGDRTVSLNADCEITIPDLVTETTASDNCTYSVVQSVEAGETVAATHEDEVEITITVTDGAGLTSACVVVLTAIDDTDPVITSNEGECPEGFEVEMESPFTPFDAPDLTIGLVVTDNCSGSIDVVQSPVAGAPLPIGDNTITITITDASGNSIECEVTITGVYTPKDLTVDCPDDIVSDEATCAQDEVSIDYEVETDENNDIDYGGWAPGSLFPLGTTTVTVTVSNGYDNDGTCTFDVTVTGQDLLEVRGNGFVIADGDITPSATDHSKFTSVPLNGSSTRTFTIVNGGASDVEVEDVVIGGVDASRFAVTSFTAGNVTACGGTKTFTVTYSGSAAAALHTANITVEYGEAGEYTFDISGATSTKLLQVRGNSIPIPDGDVTPELTDWSDFGTVNLNTTRSRQFRIHNVGTQVLNLTGTPRVQISGPGAANFNVTLQPSATVSAGSNVGTTIVFTAAAVGEYFATVSIFSDDLGANPYTFTIRAQVLNPNMSITGGSSNFLIASGDMDPRTQDNTDFGVRAVGSATALSYTVRNASGGGVLALNGSPRVVISGPGAAAFSVTSTPTATIAAGSSSLLRITFNPTAAGVYNATVSIMNNDTMPGKNPYTFAIRGATPGAMPFGGHDLVIGSKASDDFELSVYPNPVADQVFIVAPETKESYRLEIVNLEGRVVFSAKTFGGRIELHAGDWMPGLYMVRALGVDVPSIRFVKLD